MSNPGSGAPAVIHLSHFDEHGGAARSAYRLHEGLRRLGATSRMIVGHKTSADPDVTQHDKSFGDKVANRIGYELGVQHALAAVHTIDRTPSLVPGLRTLSNLQTSTAVGSATCNCPP